MTTIERSVTINHDHELYVIKSGDGYTCLGFDVCLARIQRILLELDMRGTASPQGGLPVARGDLRTYDTYVILMDILRAKVEASGERAICELSPQLLGLEGHRVQVIDQHGHTRRFIVGKSTGWLPCHLEVKRRDSSGGDPAALEYRHVTDLGYVR